MKTLLLIGSLLCLILGASVLGWLARWYKYGGRCGPGGLQDGIPNIDVESGTVHLDGSEPVGAAATKKPEVAQKIDKATEGTRAALSTLKAGYADGRKAGTMPDAPGDDSTGARLAAVAGSVATKVESGVSSAAETVKEKAAGLADSAKSTVSSVKQGFSEGKAPGDTPESYADGSAFAKVAAVVGGAAAAVGAGAAKATESVKDAASSASASAKSTVSSVKEGFAEGKAPGDTPDAPADGSTAAKVGAAVGGATAAVGSGAAKATESVKDAASSASETVQSTASSVKEGFVEGKAPGDTPDAPADGSMAAKVGAAVGGATAAVGAGAAKVSESVKDAASSASAKSTVSSVKEGFAEGKAPGDTPDAPADGSMAAKAGAVVGGATAAVGAGAAKATESVKDAASSASVQSTASSAKVGFAEGDKPDSSAESSVAAKVGGAAVVGAGAAVASGSIKDVASGAAQNQSGVEARSRELAGRAGSTLGQEDGHTNSTEDGLSGSGSMRSRFAGLAAEAENDVAEGSGMDAGMIEIPETLSEAEVEAQRLIEEGGEVGAPDSALTAPRGDHAPDDLKLISGVGPKIETTLNEKGIYYFDQIANFGGRDLAWADRTLGFKGRAVRDRWIPQAKALTGRIPKRGATVKLDEREETSSDAAPINAPLKLAEAEALRLIEQEGGYSATAANRPAAFVKDNAKLGNADDLSRIRGIGDKLHSLLNGLGIYHFHQIAEMKASDIAWVDSKLNFKGRIIRDRWVPQAEKFARGKQS